MSRFPEELALESLSQWWEDAGVPLDKPAIRTNPDDIRPTQERPKPATEKPKATPRILRKDPIQEAKSLAESARTLEELSAAVSEFDGCDLKDTARNTVFSDGSPDADLMIIGEGPGRDEDLAGKPFVGRSGQLLDRMFATIGFSRDDSVYITNVLPWRAPGNRAPETSEAAICAPFLHRHIALQKPKLIVTVGKSSAHAVLSVQDTISRLRGRRMIYTSRENDLSIPCIPMTHPAFLLRRPAEKARAWQDLLLISKVADELGVKHSKVTNAL